MKLMNTFITKNIISKKKKIISQDAKYQSTYILDSFRLLPSNYVYLSPVLSLTIRCRIYKDALNALTIHQL